MLYNQGYAGYGAMPSLYRLSTAVNCVTKNELNSISAFLSGVTTVLNIGSGSYTRLAKPFLDCVPSNVRTICLDILPGPHVDIVADCLSIPLPDSTVDLVLSFAVIEHLARPEIAASEMSRVCKKNGYILLTVPFLQGYHADPDDFRRFTLAGLPLIFDSAEVISSGVSSGPFSAVAWIVRDVLSFGAKGSFLYNLTRLVSSLIVYPFQYIDKFTSRNAGFSRCACEYYYLLRNA